jgi:hypothetical protein
VWIYNFGKKAKKPYRQRGASTLVPPRPAAPASPPSRSAPAVDPAMVGTGLGLVLLAVFLQVAARRRRALLA